MFTTRHTHLKHAERRMAQGAWLAHGLSAVDFFREGRTREFAGVFACRLWDKENPGEGGLGVGSCVNRLGRWRLEFWFPMFFSVGGLWLAGVC